MARKGENIRKRKDGRWEARITAKTGRGEKKVFSLYGSTYQETKEKAYDARKTMKDDTALRYMVQKGIGPAAALNMNWTMPAEGWLQEMKKTKKHSTFIKYRNIYQNHIEAHLKACPLNREIDESMIRDICERCPDLSNSLKRSIRSVLRSIFRYAADNYKLDVPELKKETYKKEQNHVQVLSKVEQARLCNYLMRHMDHRHLGILICVTTGIRLGEVCSLKWSDVDFSAGIIRIRTTVQRISTGTGGSGTELLETVPKTSCSEREIPLPDILLDLLDRYHSESGYVVNGESPMEPRTYQNIWRRCQESAGITYKNFHSLRHTFATNCVAKGIDAKSLSEILGHSDVKTTLNRYVHPSAEAKRSCISSAFSCFSDSGLLPPESDRGQN